MKNYRKEEKYINKGITLVSLVVTIVILLILAGITMSVLIGNEGVINKTSLIIEDQEYKSEREVLEQDVINIRNKNIGKVPIDELDQEFKNNDLVNESEEDCTVQLYLNGSAVPNGILVHTKKGYDHAFDGESIITMEEFESRYPDYDKTYDIIFKDEIVNTQLEHIIENAEPLKGIDIDISKNENGEFTDYSLGKTKTVGNNTYRFSGWKDITGKVWNNGVYSRNNVPDNNAPVILTAYWGGTTYTLNVRVNIENLEDTNFEKCTTTFEWNFTQTVTISNNTLQTYKNQIEEIINEINKDLDINNVDIKENIEITEEDLQNGTEKTLTLNIGRKRYTLTTKPGENSEYIDTITGSGQYKAGQTVTLQATAKDREGYTLKSFEWTTSDGTKFDNKMPKENITVTANAKFEPNTYKVVANLDGGTVKNANGWTTVGNTVTKNVTYDGTYGTFPTIEKLGYDFNGWYTEENGAGQKVTSDKIVQITNEQNIYAYFTPATFNISLNTNGGTVKDANGWTIEGNIATKDATYTTTLGTLPTLEKTGYTFNGWYTAVTGGNKIESTTAVPPANTTYYAQWIPITYTIEYNANSTTGFTGSTASSSHTYDSEKELTVNGFTKTGYTFAGWIDGTGTNYANGQMVKNLSNISGANVILYAQWEPTQYSITYNLDGGTSNNPTTYTMETEDFSLSKPFKSGYTFLGWTGSNGETIEKTVTITKGSIGDKTYTANWDREEGIVPVIRELDTTGFSTSTVTNLVRNDNESTNFTINGVTYETVIYYFPEDVTISSTTLPDTSGVLTLGNDADVAKSSTALTASSGHMVVAIFEKNLTIESTGTITAYRYKKENEDSYYGGPKGMYICVRGNLTNDGTISMTARGANATGDNVYLYSNDATNWEYVPAAGATGGVAKSFKNTSADQSAAGASGNDGSTVANSVRATGGGGSGGVRKTNCANANYEVKSGAGGRGTSYSGGSGGGGAYLEGAGSNVTGGTGSSTGGAGGAGKGARNYTQSGTQANAGGGAGNPGANGVKINSSGTTSTYKGSDGTGGLLIIYGNEVNNIGNIESKGSNGGNTASSNNNKSVGGGASGGGSINIFYNTLYNNEGNIYVTGGTGGTKYGTGKAGGNGGAGTVTSGSLANHRYTSDV